MVAVPDHERIRITQELLQTALTGVLALVVLFLAPHLARAGDADLEQELQAGLEQGKVLVEEALLKLQSGESIESEVSELAAGAEEISVIHMLLEERFRLRAEALDAAGRPKAVERQSAVSSAYLSAINEYLSLVQSIQQSALSDQPEPETRNPQPVLQQLKLLLDRVLPERHLPILGSLPYRHLNLPARQPDESVSVIPAYKGGDQTVTAEDTASTAIAPINDEIASLARSLNWSPVLIYEHVKNSIETEWYGGCMKGAVETLRQRSGNDCDQATLFTALLRASGFPARYVRGTMEFFAGGRNGVPMNRIKDLTGIDDPVTIGEYFQKAGIPYEPVIQGGKIVNFRIEHVWVESEIPYANYRGAIIDGHGKTWLGLDTAIKTKDYENNEPLDIYEQSALSDQLSATRDDYLSAVHPETPVDFLRNTLNSELSTQNPGLTYSDFLRTRTLIPEVMNIVPDSMQFYQRHISHEYTDIPDDLLHKVRFKAVDNNNSELLNFELSTYLLSNKQIIVTYEPESVEDQEIINSYGGLGNTPAYLVRLRPALKIDGERRAVGKDGLPMGEDYNLTIELTSPSGTERITNTMITGNVTAIGIVAGKAVQSSEYSVQSEGKTAEELLYNEAIHYMDMWNQAEDELASLLHLTITRPIPTVVTVGSVLDVTRLLDSPHDIDWRGVYIDADLRRIETVQSSEYGVQSERQRLFMELSSLEGSALENRVFEEDFQVESISTAKLFQVVGAYGDTPLQTIDRSNIDVILPTLDLAGNIKEDITNAVNQGFALRTVNSELSFEDWTGIGYIKEDPETGESGWMLSGSIAGGMSIVNPADWANITIADILSNPYADKPNDDPLSASRIFKVAATDLQRGIVNSALSDQKGKELAVYVLDKDGRPVKNARVTFRVAAGGGNLVCRVKLGSGQEPEPECAAITDGKGMARADITPGKHTNDNPAYIKLNNDEFETQIGLNLVTASVKTYTGAVSLGQPFEIYGLPDTETEYEEPGKIGWKKIYITKKFGDMMHAMANNPLGDLVAGVVDQYGNPISNVDLQFRVVDIKNSDGTPLPPYDEELFRSLMFYHKTNCEDSAFPLFGECPPYYPLHNNGGIVEQARVKSRFFGGMISAVAGNTVYTRYDVEVTTDDYKGVEPGQFTLFTLGSRNNDLSYLMPYLDMGRLEVYTYDRDIARAVKVGGRTPLVSRLNYYYTEPIVGPKDENTNKRLVRSNGIVHTVPVVTGGGHCLGSEGSMFANVEVHYDVTEGDGIITNTVSRGNGIYEAEYRSVKKDDTTEPAPPAKNRIEAWAEVDHNCVPEVLSEVDPPSGTKYVLTPNVPERPVNIKTGQNIIISGDDYSLIKTCIESEAPLFTCTGEEGDRFHKEAYTVYSVDVKLDFDTPAVLDESGMTLSDAWYRYRILPDGLLEDGAPSPDPDAAYRAYDAYLNIYEDDSWVDYIVGEKTTGEGTGAIVSGSYFDINKKHTAQMVLNLGSDIEVRSEEVGLPIGQFRMVTNDEEEVPVIGAVTDGSATIRLQLTKNSAWENDSTLIWSIVDPQMTDSTTGMGTLLDENNNPADAVAVKFDEDGVAEVVYRAPDTFVRWGSAKEEDDKVTPERYIQPTFNITRYLLTKKDVLPQITLKRPPVILVHGLWGNGDKTNDEYAWKNFEPKFNDKELYDVFSVNYYENGQVRSVHDHVKELIMNLSIEDAFEDVRKRGFAVHKIDIIAHSMGGLLTREYCEQFKDDCENRIRRFITIATPHFGSELADILRVYRDNIEHFPNPFSFDFPPTTCVNRINMFVNGAFGKGRHPVEPVGGAIDDLASGRLPDFIPIYLTSPGRWFFEYTPLSSTTNPLKTHTIVGVVPEILDGINWQIFLLWNRILKPCGLTRANVFGEDNDRIVKRTSQLGGLSGDVTSVFDFEDHFSLRNAIGTINKIRLLLDKEDGSVYFTNQ